VCAETPIKLRRCRPGEMGSVIARYQGLKGYDWLAIPLVPYLYSEEDPADVPDYANQEAVRRMRYHYRETRLGGFVDGVPEGGFLHGGWTELLGVAYERRIFAIRFNTSEEQDERLMDELNQDPNHTHFNLLFSNCSDFARTLLNHYYPEVFRRSIFPDAGMTTPKQIGYKLVRLGRRHPQMEVTVFEIPQIPGNRGKSHSNKSISESLVTTAYAVPLAVVNPYLTGGIFVDYLVRGRFRMIPKHPLRLTPEHLSPLTGKPDVLQNLGPVVADAELPPIESGSEVDELNKHLRERIISYE
jgi:hypothetical protein